MIVGRPYGGIGQMLQSLSQTSVGITLEIIRVMSHFAYADTTLIFLYT